MDTPSSPSSAIAFDFDGTIADSFQAVVQELYQAVHHRPVSTDEVEQLRHLSLVQTLRSLHIPWWHALLVARSVRSRMMRDMGRIAPVRGIPEVIAALSGAHTLFILSSNDARNIRRFLELHGLASYVADIYGDADPLHKSAALHRLMKAKQLNGAASWYIGDQPWDARAAHRVGMKAAAVTWGYGSSASLKRQHPEALISRPEELLTLFSKQ